ncbi:MAG: hypothetical protein K2Q03_01290 [Sphingobacteriaceae bacterium]|nr:hypothetical protein [Sphingobacteriaceae bacterium]
MKRSLFVCMVISVFSIHAVAQITSEEPQTETLKTEKPQNWSFKFVPLDLPFQLDVQKNTDNIFFKSYQSMSMQQAISMNYNLSSAYNSIFYQLVMKNGPNYLYNHFKIKGYYSYGILPAISSLIYTQYLRKVPGNYLWLEAEGIKAIAESHQVSMSNSYNVFSNDVPVAKIKDEELVVMKKTYAADFSRMYVAGQEIRILNVTEGRKSSFFANSDNDFFTIITRLLPNILEQIQAFNTKNDWGNLDNAVGNYNAVQKKIESRSFAGPNPLASWVFNMLSPDASFEKFGKHQSGIGIDRYARFTDLPKEGQDFLDKINNRSYINYLNPMAFGIHHISLWKDWKTNFAIYQWYTSFGTDVKFDLYLKNDKINLSSSLHQYENLRNKFLAFELQLLNYPILRKKNMNLYVSPRVLLGQQPRNQLFVTEARSFIGLMDTKIDLITQNRIFFPSINLGYKTKGWVAGNPYIAENIYGSIGLNVRF